MRFAWPERWLPIAGLCVVLATPAAADDPFRSTAPDPAPAAKPVPHRAPAPEAEPPPAAVPQPAPSQFPPAFIARVRQAAQAQGLSLPDALTFAEATTPANYRSLLGAWGPARWSGGNPFMLIILGIDSSGNVDLVGGAAACCADRFYHQARWFRERGRIVDGKIMLDYLRQFDNPGTMHRQEWTLSADGRLRGVDTASQKVVTIDLPRFQ